MILLRLLAPAAHPLHATDHVVCGTRVGIWHPHDFVGDPIGLALVLVARGADGELRLDHIGLQQAVQSAIANITLQTTDSPATGVSQPRRS